MLRFNLPTSKRWVFFILVTLLCYLVGMTIVALLLHNGMTTPTARVATVIQDLFVFILPAIITAVIITRQPADFLMVARRPSAMTFILIAATILAAIPAMNLIIEWNASLNLPDSLAGLERWMKSAEEASGKMVETLIGGTGYGQLLIAALIIAVLAGFSEELFFRGALQRLFITSNVRRWVAVWATAFLFSLLHFQFFGFVPRLLLGAYFGYLMVWTRSLWPGIAAHIFNNLLASYALWLKMRGTQTILERTDIHVSVAFLSIIATAALIWLTYRINTKTEGNHQ